MNSTTEQPADLILVGDVVTVSDTQPSAEAVAIREGTIMAVGMKADILKFKGDRTVIRDLSGKAILPGFIDAHGHIAQFLLTKPAPMLWPPPAGEVGSIANLVRIMKQYIADYGVPAGELVLAMGYDDAEMAEHRHPTAQELDEISTEHPVFLVHTSGHIGVLNSLGLRQAGITKDMADPSGGRIVRDPKTGEPTGVLQEQAMLLGIKLAKPRPTDQLLKEFADVQRYYASFGITTAQDGFTPLDSWQFLQEAAKTSSLLIDIVAYPQWTQADEIITPATKVGFYDNHLKIGGVKIVADGSPQGRTAYLSQPYLVPPPDEKPGYCGYPEIKQEELDSFVDRFYANDWQIMTHANGDAAIDMLLESLEKAVARHGKKNHRHIINHAQTIREDQLDRAKELAMMPSFFVSHTFFWGDWYRNTVLGEERAGRICPLVSAQNRGFVYTIHNDSPVVPPDMMRLMWAAVNRTTRSNFVLGPDQCVTPLAALKAITIGAAYQYFEEKTKGSIEPGKLADLVVLAENPLKAEPAQIKDIAILETIKEGKTVYTKN